MKDETPDRLIFSLTPADREALELVRIKLGTRSSADTLRELIRRADPRRQFEAEAQVWRDAGLRAMKALAEQGVPNDETSNGGIILPVGPRTASPGARLKKR